MRRSALVFSILMMVFTFSNCDDGTPLYLDSVDVSTDVEEEISEAECPACNCNCNVTCPGVDTHVADVVDPDVESPDDMELPSEDVEPPPEDVEPPPEDVEPPPEDVEPPPEDVEPPPEDVEPPPEDVEPPPEDVEPPPEDVEPPPEDVQTQTFTVSIMSTPIMTNCTIDGEFVGLVPMDTNALELTEGSHTLLLQKGGCEDLEEVIEVSASSTSFYYALICGK